MRDAEAGELPKPFTPHYQAFAAFADSLPV